ncbi:PAS-domain containing protein [Pseudotabrizicola sp. L79]|uniref:PAS-domain containing protein n=1 Tax=Pseudotabrizicola sp. L79 TaxID=3118402 RepID=UPI002F91E873
MGSDLALGVGLGITSILAAFGSLLVLLGFHSPSAHSKPSIFREKESGTIFLFDGDRLIDCTPGGRAVLAASPARGDNWMRLMAHLGTQFPNLERYLNELAERGAITLEGEDAEGMPLLLHAELRGGITRISVTDASASVAAHASDPMVHRAVTEELSNLRSMMTQAPIMAWREREDGDVIWANTQYVLAAVDSLGPDQDLTWPLPRLFDRLASAQGAAGQRQKLRTADGSTRWFDLTMKAENAERRVYAVPCDSAVVAETNLRDLMQTLTKTFAHLTVGLAIFDSQRQLQMFNPALLDLTGLPPNFLSSRPTVVAMLDAMRDRNMVPEPKDYHRWRQQLVDLDESASGGVYSEIWSLAGDQTYRVVGRPHTNGSLALMFEDISNEVSRTRRYRADLELGQSVIDSMSEAVAVFSETGQLVMTNQAYGALWENDPSETPVDVSIKSAAQQWSSHCAPSPVWAEIIDYVATVGDRDNWVAETRLLDGRLLRCRLHPLESGATLIGFSPIAAERPEVEEVVTSARRRA